MQQCGRRFTLAARHVPYAEPIEPMPTIPNKINFMMQLLPDGTPERTYLAHVRETLAAVPRDAVYRDMIVFITNYAAALLGHDTHRKPVATAVKSSGIHRQRYVKWRQKYPEFVKALEYVEGWVQGGRGAQYVEIQQDIAAASVAAAVYDLALAAPQAVKRLVEGLDAERPVVYYIGENEQTLEMVADAQERRKSAEALLDRIEATGKRNAPKAVASATAGAQANAKAEAEGGGGTVIILPDNGRYQPNRDED